MSSRHIPSSPAYGKHSLVHDTSRNAGLALAYLLSLCVSAAAVAQPVSEVNDVLVTQPNIVAVYIGYPNLDFYFTMNNLYTDIVRDGSYLSWMSEYGISGPPTFAGAWIIPAPGGTLDTPGVGSYIDQQIHIGALPDFGANEFNTIYMVHVVPGQALISGYNVFGIPIGNAPGNGWCQMHVEYVSSYSSRVFQYAILPSMIGLSGPNESCNVDGIEIDAETFGATHELAEAITDPASAIFKQSPTGISVSTAWAWVDPSRSGFLNPFEIADICKSAIPDFTVEQLYFGHSYAVSQLWSNSRNRCFTPTPKPYAAMFSAIEDALQ